MVKRFFTFIAVFVIIWLGLHYLVKPHLATSYEIPQVYQQKKAFQRTYRSYTSDISFNKTGAEIKLNEAQAKDLEKYLHQDLSFCLSALRKIDEDNNVEITNDLRTLNMRLTSRSVNKLDTYMPRIAQDCEILQVLQGEEWVLDVNVYNLGNKRFAQAIYPKQTLIVQDLI